MNSPTFTFNTNNNTNTGVSDPIFAVNALPLEDRGANITFYLHQTEFLKVAADGFYVKGKKVEADDEEAKSVYKAFREFLIWSALVRE